MDLEQSRRPVDGRQMDAYDFTLVLREVRGVGITFNHVKFEVYQPGWDTAGGEITDRLELPAHCELHLPFSSAGFTDPLWTITLMGNDERGQPVQVAIDVAPPPEPSRPSRWTQLLRVSLPSLRLMNAAVSSS
jgi:hypothetical protein